MPLNAEARILDRERRYLERLMLSRFNFYLVFIALFLAAYFDPHIKEPERERAALLVGAIVSFLMSLAVTRTAAFVSLLLDKIETNHPDHPFARLANRKKDSPATWSDLVLRWPRAYWYHVVLTWFVTIYCLYHLDLAIAWWLGLFVAAFIGFAWCVWGPRKGRQDKTSLADWSDPTA